MFDVTLFCSQLHFVCNILNRSLLKVKLLGVVRCLTSKYIPVCKRVYPIKIGDNILFLAFKTFWGNGEAPWVKPLPHMHEKLSLVETGGSLVLIGQRANQICELWFRGRPCFKHKGWECWRKDSLLQLWAYAFYIHVHPYLQTHTSVCTHNNIAIHTHMHRFLKGFCFKSCLFRFLYWAELYCVRFS